MTGVVVGLALFAVLAFPFGFMYGRLQEWRRAIDYINANGDRDALWLSSGIAADDHHKREWRHFAKERARGR